MLLNDFNFLQNSALLMRLLFTLDSKYYNDMPRFLEELSDGHISQNSCLHGNANFDSILTWGNGMLSIWDSGSARIFNYKRGRIHDYGACSVRQLLLGYDADLEERVQMIFDVVTDDDAADDDAAYAYDDDKTSIYDDHFEKEYGDDFFQYNDGSNPCLGNPHYYVYLISTVFSHNQGHNWDYILMNDNTRSPARNISRQESLYVLEETYLPLFLETGSRPIFLATYAYWSPYRDMGGLRSVPEFTSLTMAGYRSYVDMLSPLLPENQQPRIAPVALAFLFVYEENRNLWKKMFHVDMIHCGPLGTYLQGLVVHHTIFGVLPENSVAIRPDMSSLWIDARRFQPNEHHRDPFPSQAEAAYLYQIAVKLCVHKQLPRTYTHYTNGEAAEYDPVDDIYKVDDLF